MTAIDMTEQALRQTLVRQLGMEAEEAGEVAGGIMDGAYDAAGIEELLNPVKDLIKIQYQKHKICNKKHNSL